jgi:hypothetical protein
MQGQYISDKMNDDYRKEAASYDCGRVAKLLDGTCLRRVPTELSKQRFPGPCLLVHEVTDRKESAFSSQKILIETFFTKRDRPLKRKSQGQSRAMQTI